MLFWLNDNAYVLQYSFAEGCVDMKDEEKCYKYQDDETKSKTHHPNYYRIIWLVYQRDVQHDAESEEKYLVHQICFA